ncbi:MAG: M23 family metallopeptidase [Parvibaculum sp.]|uniref:M23 family metallopeptidase n=1 Tax=Parvibaculum sp. TaxID=2024848 RepID=UPI0027177D40|nr:M23 family metallopeptidase [Parvibaculum sp.]MDO8838785.1 M23 family metallopeptidase [Parvibaculum sp.]
MKRLAALIGALLLAAPVWAEPSNSPNLELQGPMEQGGLIVGMALPGARATLQGAALPVAENGIFAFGFDRDHGGTARLIVAYPDGTHVERVLEVAPREWAIQRIDGLPPKYVSPPAEMLARIATERELKTAARAARVDETWFALPFIWPVTGPVSGVFGSQRIYNGEPRRPHYGVDVAAPTGTPIVAPQAGIVTLAHPDMFFEGGLVFLDHGHGVTSVIMHMSRVDVTEGQAVARGDVLGAVGATGRATGPHLHWGMFWRGAQVDPVNLVGTMPEAAPTATGGD